MNVGAKFDTKLKVDNKKCKQVLVDTIYYDVVSSYNLGIVLTLKAIMETSAK